MRPSHPLAILGAVIALVETAVVVYLGVSLFQVVTFRIVAVYALVLPLAGVSWYWLDSPLGVPEAIGIAALASVAVAALSLPEPSSLPPWLLVPFLMQMIVPTAFMLPLGAARTWRQRIGVVAVAVLPLLTYLSYSLVLNPGSSGTLLAVVSTVGGWFVLFAVAGIPLFALGDFLARGDESVGEQVGRLRARVTG